MATIITEPSNTNPATVDWQAALSKITLIGAGMLIARLTEWETTASPSVAQYSRFELNGVYYQCLTDESISGWSGISSESRCWVYAVPGTSSATFEYSSTEPTWSNAKGGWFNGNNRALFSLYKKGTTLYSGKQLMTPPTIIPVLLYDPTTPAFGQIWIRGDL